MGKTILVVGFGPGISTSVAERFGSAGFSVGLVARNQERLASGVKALGARGIQAGAYPADARDPAAIRAAVSKARAALGPIAILHWNAYGGSPAGNLLEAEIDAVRGMFDAAVLGLVAAVQESLADLRQTKGAILVTNGALGEISPATDAAAASLNAMGLAVANAAKHKLVGVLASKLQGDGVYVGEVMVAGLVKGTAWDQGNATIDAAAVAQRFWELYEAREENRARVT